jgi:hypothetical protein
MSDVTKSRRVRCISLWQPWASLMACGAKFVETRSWNTMARGEVWIHAALNREGLAEARADAVVAGVMAMRLGVAVEEWEEKLPFGALVGKGVLQVAIPGPRCAALYPGQVPFGNFARGRFGHVYKGLEAIEPVPMRGKQGFFYAEVAV